MMPLEGKAASTNPTLIKKQLVFKQYLLVLNEIKNECYKTLKKKYNHR